VGKVLVCDDEPGICQMLEYRLRKSGHKVETVTSGGAAKKKLEAAAYDVVISDMKMPDVDGVEVLEFARQTCPDCERIVITAFEDFEVAKKVARIGVFAFHVKGPPTLPEVVANSVEQAMDKIREHRENQAHRRDAAPRNSLDNIVGTSPAMQQLKQTIRTVAPAGSTILICGASGTGKELVARAIHACSPQAAEPFVPINCGAFPETLLESELFGYMRGAFTGANQNKRGLFEVANGGSIFLDEITEMSLSMQVKLLRVLQESAIRPVGGTAETPINVRVIAATNKDLDKLVADNLFREDLYYRINVIPIQVPRLRERGEDIELLAKYFLNEYRTAMGKTIRRISPESMEELKSYDWPGNVRQLKNTVERAVAMSTSDEVTVEIYARTRAAAVAANAAATAGVVFPPDGLDMERYVANIEKSLLQTALQRSNGVQTRAATLLNLSYRSLRHLLKKYDL
jgi:two-component system, NtrC family, response regulator PilR